MPFDKWFEAVNQEVIQIAGVGVGDLPDCTFYDWYQDEVTPKEAAEWALGEAGFPFE